MLHEEGKLSGIQGCVIGNLRSVRVTTAIKVYIDDLDEILGRFQGTCTHTIQEDAMTTRCKSGRYVFPD
jgi:hypothetical protein